MAAESQTDIDDPSGWTSSASAWIESVSDGDWTRKVLLDGVMLQMCGDVANRRVLDIGCGEGRFCRMLAAKGAHAAGLDPTVPLLQHARKLSHLPLVRGSGERLPFTAEAFDVAVFYLTLLDIPDYRTAIREAVRVLKPGGLMVIGNIAPHASTSLTGWVRDEEGNRLYYPIDHYLAEYEQEVAWKRICIKNYHRPLSAYMKAFLECGLVLKQYEEPAPSAEAVAANPSWEYHVRVPYTHAMLWQKSRS